MPADPLALLAAGRYAELDAGMTAVQAAYERGEIDDEELLAAFRPFYESEAGTESALDRWVLEKPRSYVAHLARGIHYKYAGINPQVGDDVRYVMDARREKRHDAFARARRDLVESLDLTARPLLSLHHLMEARGSLPWFTTNHGLLEESIRIDPANVIVRRKYLTTLAPRNHGDWRSMVAFVQDARESGVPARVVAKLQHELDVERAVIEWPRERDLAKAEQRYRELLAVDPDNTRIGELLIAALYKQDRCADVAAEATRQIGRDARHAGLAYSDRGLCRMRGKEIAGAIGDYEAAAAIGEVWAQKELARIYWDGRIVPRDAEKSTAWLRRAARNGDSPAQADYRSRTGQRIEMNRPAIQWMLPGILLFGASLVISLNVQNRRGFLHPKEQLRRISYSFTRAFTGVLMLSGGGGLLISATIYPSMEASPATMLALAVLGAFGAWHLATFLRVVHEIDGWGLLHGRVLGERRRVAWSAVRRIGYSRITRRFRIEADTPGVVHVGCRMDNAQAFARAALAEVSSQEFDRAAIRRCLELVRLHDAAVRAVTEIEDAE